MAPLSQPMEFQVGGIEETSRKRWIPASAGMTIGRVPADVSTTMIYTQVLNRSGISVASPFDLL